MKHPVQEPPIIARRTRPAPPLRRQQRPDQRPFRIRQISAIHDCSSKRSSESEVRLNGNPFCQRGLSPSRLREGRSEEHTSELQSLMRISYAVFCLKKKKTHTT